MAFQRVVQALSSNIFRFPYSRRCYHLLASLSLLTLLASGEVKASTVSIKFENNRWYQLAIPATKASQTPELLFEGVLDPTDYLREWVLFAYDSDEGYLELDPDAVLVPGEAV